MSHLKRLKKPCSCIWAEPKNDTQAVSLHQMKSNSINVIYKIFNKAKDKLKKKNILDVANILQKHKLEIFQNLQR